MEEYIIISFFQIFWDAFFIFLYKGKYEWSGNESQKENPRINILLKVTENTERYFYFFKEKVYLIFI